MASVTQNSGIGMMLKAMGVDPQALLQKGAELEAMAKTLATELHSKVSHIEARISAIEGTLETRVASLESTLLKMEILLSAMHAALGANISVISRLESYQAGVTPAGETFDAETVNQQPTKDEVKNG
jgi:hypothetical protein